jgi:hypothetical protein
VDLGVDALTFGHRDDLVNGLVEGELQRGR